MSKAKEYSLNEEHRMAWKTANEAARIDGISHNMKSAAYAMGDLEHACTKLLHLGMRRRQLSW